MQTLLFIITIIVLSQVLGTLFGILLTIVDKLPLKIKVLILTFLHPLVFLGILWVLFPNKFADFPYFILIFLVAFWIGNLFFSSIRYMVDFQIINDQLTIHYINSRLQQKTVSISIHTVKELELGKMKSWLDYPVSLRYTNEDGLPKKYLILNKVIWVLLNEELKAQQQ